MKNNIKLINLNLGQTKVNYNFYNKPAVEHQFDWSNGFKKNEPVRAKKQFKTKSNFRNKRHGSQMSSSHQKDYLKTGSIDDLPQTPVTGRFSKGVPKAYNLTQSQFDINRNNKSKPVNGIKGLVNKFFEPNSDDGNYINTMYRITRFNVFRHKRWTRPEQEVNQTKNTKGKILV